MQVAAKTVLSVAIGAIAAPYLIWCWAQVAGRGLIFDPLFASGFRDSSLHAAIASADFIASLLMLLPAALALLSLGKPRLALHTGLAAMALFATTSAIIGWPMRPSTWLALVANLSPYIALCTGVWICAAIAGRPPNNSFKPKLLRSGIGVAG